MLTLILIVLLLVVLAWAAHNYLPHPLGSIIAAVIVIAAVIYLVSGLGDVDDADAALAALRL